jgi:hypothetical protein
MENKPTIKTSFPAASPLPIFAFCSLIFGFSSQPTAPSPTITWPPVFPVPVVDPPPGGIPRYPGPLLSLRPLSSVCPGVALRQAGCLLPKPPILPRVLLSVVLLSPSRLSVFVAMIQLCKTKPISSRPKPSQLLISQRFTPIFRPAPLQKNKPNQTQFITAKPDQTQSLTHRTTSHIRNTTYEAKPDWSMDFSKNSPYDLQSVHDVCVLQSRYRAGSSVLAQARKQKYDYGTKSGE